MSLIEDLQTQHHEALDREGQAWMAATGAAIGFALHESSKATWNAALAFTAGAVLCWCGSFAAGIFRTAAHRNSLRANVEALSAKRRGETDKQVKTFVDQHEELCDKQVAWRSAQLWLLFAGALAYLGASVTGAWLQHASPSAVHAPPKVDADD